MGGRAVAADANETNANERDQSPLRREGNRTMSSRNGWVDLGLLIDNVKSCRPLWDKTMADKTDLVVRERLWDRIATKLGCTKPIAKAKWKNCRDAYRKLLLKTDRGGRQPKWPYYKKLDFLKTVMSPHPLRNRPSDDNSEDSNYGAGSPCEEEEALIDAKADAAMTTPKDVEVAEAVPRHFLDEVKSEVGVASVSPRPTHEMQVEDEDYQFLQSLYPHLRQVTGNRKLPLRIKIEQVIYEELYGGQPH